MLNEENKAITCCFWGHDRILIKAHRPEVYNLTMDFFIKLYNKGYRYFVLGQFIGYGAFAANVIVNAKAYMPDVKFIFVLDCKNSFCLNKAETETMEKIKANADEFITMSENPKRGLLQKTYRFVIDASNAVISYQYKKYGRTAEVIKYARSKGLRIYNICEELNAMNE